MSSATQANSLTALATPENAEGYAASNEQFAYCLMLLGMSASARGVDEIVNRLEDLFDALNAPKPTIPTPPTREGLRARYLDDEDFATSVDDLVYDVKSREASAECNKDAVGFLLSDGWDVAEILGQAGGES